MSNIIKPMIFDLSELEIKARKGDKLACYILGRSNDSEENGAEQNFEKAKQIHIQAYKPLLKLIEEEKQNLRKQAFSKFCLGAYYYFGFGEVEIDKNKAFGLIHDCAMQGHLPAIYDLGANFYYNGIGTEKNLKFSEYYLKMAVDAGLPRAKVKYEQYRSEYENEIEK